MKKRYLALADTDYLSPRTLYKSDQFDCLGSADYEAEQMLKTEPDTDYVEIWELKSVYHRKSVLNNEVEVVYVE